MTPEEAKDYWRTGKLPEEAMEHLRAEKTTIKPLTAGGVYWAVLGAILTAAVIIAIIAHILD